MRNTLRISLLLSLWLGIISSCNRLELPAPVPSTKTVAAAEAAISVTYDWGRAVFQDNWIVIPFANQDNPFAGAKKTSYRFAVIKTDSISGKDTGRIAELVVDGPAPGLDKAALLALAGTKPIINGQAPMPVAGLSGWLLVYSLDYQNLLAGLVYQNAEVLPQRVQLTTNYSTSPEKDDQVSGSKLISITVTTCGYVNGYLSNCIFDTYTIDTGSSTPWGGSSGSTGGGSSTGTGSSNSTSVAAPVADGPKVNPKQEVKCFTASQPAIVTVFVNQAIPGTNALNGGTVGVGHTFIGIEQNGITRYMGYYPREGAMNAFVGLGVNYRGEIHDNSGSPYNVSISTTVTGAQLGAIVNYISNSVPATYNLNTYNCADFGIAVGNLAGMNLPATTTSAALGLFNGRSPGQLGQDIMNMTPPSGTNVDTNGGNAPTKQGSCP